MKLMYILIGILILIVPIIVDGLVNIPVPSVADEKTWIGFYGSYFGGLLGAFAVIFITLYQINKNKKQEIYKEDIKDLAYLKMIEKFIDSNQFLIFTELLSPTLEKFMEYKKNRDLTVDDLENYFMSLKGQITINIPREKNYKLRFSSEDLGLNNFFDDKELFDIDRLVIRENLFKVDEKHHDWTCYLNTEELINEYINALSSIESIRYEFSINSDQEIDEVILQALDLTKSINPEDIEEEDAEQIKELVRKIYSRKIIGDRFISFFLLFHRRKELINFLKLIRNEIAEKNKRIEEYREKKR